MGRLESKAKMNLLPSNTTHLLRSVNVFQDSTHTVTLSLDRKNKTKRYSFSWSLSKCFNRYYCKNPLIWVGQMDLQPGNTTAAVTPTANTQELNRIKRRWRRADRRWARKRRSDDHQSTQTRPVWSSCQTNLVLLTIITLSAYPGRHLMRPIKLSIQKPLK